MISTVICIRGYNPMEWAYGVTTVPERISNGCLSATLQSLEKAGFGAPHIFVDAAVDEEGQLRVPGWVYDYPVTVRHRRMGIHAHWVLSFAELCFLAPKADRFALFQDDIMMNEGTREFLESYRIPEHAYLNLFTSPRNKVKNAKGFRPAKHRCHGAHALVFPQAAARELLATKSIMKYMANHRCGEGVDIVIAMSLKKRKHRPFVHHPSIIRIIDTPSTVGHVNDKVVKHE